MNPTSRPERRRGASAVEFCLWLPVLVVMFSGMVDASWMMSRYHNVVRAARDGARVGVSIIESDETTAGADVKAAAEAHATAILDGVGMTCDSRCTVSSTIVSGSEDMLEVTVSYDYEPIVGLLPMNTTMSSRFTMMLQQEF